MSDVETHTIGARRFADGSAWQVDVVEGVAVQLQVRDAFGSLAILTLDATRAMELQDAIDGAADEVNAAAIERLMEENKRLHAELVLATASGAA